MRKDSNKGVYGTIGENITPNLPSPSVYTIESELHFNYIHLHWNDSLLLYKFY